jgi:hypothetical protein
MKKLKYIITSILFLNLFNHHTHAEFIVFTDFESIKTKSFYRVILLPSLLGITTYIHKNKLQETIKNYPVTSCLFLYMIGNYLIDSFYEYKKINSILNILQSSEKINGYLLCAMMLKKDTYLSKNNQNIIENQVISEKIHKYSGFYINEIEEITAQFNKKALEYLNKFDVIHFDFQFTDLENIIVKENITIDQIMPLFQTDPELYTELLALQKDENADIDKILQKIGLKIKNEIQLILKKI